MAKKVKLDILDISIDDKIQGSLPEEISREEDKNGQTDVKITNNAYVARIKAWAHKPLFWIIAVAVTFFGLIMGISILVFYEQGPSLPVKQQEKNIAQPITSKKGNMALFEGFIIDLKDEKSNTRIVLCDIAIELESSRETGAIESRVDARDAIYDFLKNRKPQELLLSEGRNRLKEDFKNELNRFFGENLVKNIYFARIEVI